MFTRYALYVVPDGIWGEFGATWLGWDTRSGKARDIADPLQHDLTNRPRKYGFHGTVRAPFHLAEDATEAELTNTARALAARLTPFDLASLQLSRLGRFFALTAPGEQDHLRSMASETLRATEALRAPLTDADLARRRQSRLTPEQDALLLRWGYPYVMEEFRFHLTLTGPVDDTDAVRTCLADALRVPLETTLQIDALCLCGEAPDGRFHVIHRLPFAA